MREYVRRLLAERYDVVAVADGQQALEAARERRPDLVLTDVMMPNLDGFGLLRELRADPRTRTIPLIMLSARAGEEARVEGLGAGADDYLIKPFSMAELIARIRAVLRRTGNRAAPAAQPAAATAIRIGDVSIDSATHVATHGGAPLDLPRREFDLLHVLMAHAGTVLARNKLMDEVWGADWFGSTKTLDVHIAGLRRRLGDDAQEPRYIHTVRGVGFRFSSPAELAG
jgi:DNA-binding response OmpR family regulator